MVILSFLSEVNVQMIADFHCDLLWYLSLDPKRTPYDNEVRCSVSQLREGGVVIQVLPIFAETGSNSLREGLNQADVFKSLIKHYPDAFDQIRVAQDLERSTESGVIGVLPAVENASAICKEDEDLEAALERLTALQRRIGKLVYVSLTWNTENRFGGGALTNAGLKDDGRKFVDYLAKKGIAIDLSHASDALAEGILAHIDKEGLSPFLMASHSNLRHVAKYPRNLPDDLAREIIRRRGVIGLNFIRYLVGKESTDSFCRQLEHLLALGGEGSVCLGADFFCPDDMRPELRKPARDLFFDQADHAGKYPFVIDLWKKQLKIDDGVLSGICHGNGVSFLERLLFQGT